MSELSKRILFAVPAAALFLFLIWMGGLYFIVPLVIITMVMQSELSNICKRAGFKPDHYFIYTIALWVLLIPFLPHAFQFGVVIFLLFIAVQVLKQSETTLQEFFTTVFCGFYAPLGMMALLILRDAGSANETGWVFLVALLLMVWGNDVFAYFGGKNFGKNSLAPAISPKKTWEGFFFGILGAFIGLFLTWYLLNIPVALAYMLPLPLLISIFGPIGDLTISKLKRAAGVKDTSNLLPGHGGLLDRFDALILAGPVCYLYLYFLKTMGWAAF